MCTAKCTPAVSDSRGSCCAHGARMPALLSGTSRTQLSLPATLLSRHRPLPFHTVNVDDEIRVSRFEPLRSCSSPLLANHVAQLYWREKGLKYPAPQPRRATRSWQRVSPSSPPLRWPALARAISRSTVRSSRIFFRRHNRLLGASMHLRPDSTYYYVQLYLGTGYRLASFFSREGRKLFPP